MQTNYLCSTKKSIKNIDIKEASSPLLSLKKDLLVIVDNMMNKIFPIKLTAGDLPSLTGFNVSFGKSRLLFIVCNPSGEIRYVGTTERTIGQQIPGIRYPNEDWKDFETILGAIDIHNASEDTNFTGGTTDIDATDITFDIYETINSDTDTDTDSGATTNTTAIGDWDVIPDTQSTAYVDLVMNFTGEDIIEIMSITSSTGGAIANIELTTALSVTFDWTTPASAGSVLTFKVRDTQGNVKNLTKTVTLAEA